MSTIMPKSLATIKRGAISLFLWEFVIYEYIREGWNSPGNPA
jgi:hypothetical protein